MPEFLSTSRGRITVDQRMVVSERESWLSRRSVRIPVRAVTSIETAERAFWPLMLLGLLAMSGGLSALVYVNEFLGVALAGLGSFSVASFLLVRDQRIKIASPTATIVGGCRSRRQLERFAGKLRAQIDDERTRSPGPDSPSAIGISRRIGDRPPDGR